MLTAPVAIDPSAAPAALPVAERLARSLVAASQDTVDAVIFYGSHLHGAHPDPRSAIDFVVVVARYRPFYRVLRRTGAVRHFPLTLAMVSRLLPPASIAFRPGDAASTMAKCLVVSRADFERALGARSRDQFLHARLVQPVRVLHARDGERMRRILRLLDESRICVISWLAPFLDEPFDAAQVAERMLSIAYRHELRPEPDRRPAELLARQGAELRRLMSAALEAAVQRGLLRRGADPGSYTLPKPIAAWERRRVRWYLMRSNARSVARWFTYVITFDGWLEYIAAKVERHTGIAPVLSERERRWPLLFLWPRVIETLRTRNGARQVPPPTTTIRQSLSFLRDPPAFMVGTGLTLGDAYRVRLPGRRLFVVTDPALIEDILVRHRDSFVKSRIYWRELRQSFGPSMGALDGEAWRRRHEEQRPYFTPKAVDGILPQVAQVTRDELDRVAAQLGAGGQVRLTELFSALNVTAILRVLFGYEATAEGPVIARRISEGHDLIAWRDHYPWRPLVAAVTGRAHRGRTIGRELRSLGDAVAASPAGADPSLLLHALVRLAQHEPRTAGRSTLATNEIIFHLAASSETQAAAEAWAIHLLSRHPEVLSRLRAELDDACGGSPAGVEHLPSLPLCRQVVHEALRLYPPVHAIMRDCVTAVELQGVRARRGASFVISLYALHRNPRLWNEPTRFDPSRFDAAHAAALPRFQYLPFGGGGRVCIGRHLAVPSIMLAVGRFVQLFDVGCAADVQPRTLSSLKPPPDLMVTLSPRMAAR